MAVKGLGTVWSSSWWPSRRAACTASSPSLAGCATSGRATGCAWSASPQPCTPPASSATAMAPAANRISCCTGRRWGTIDAREPGGEFASWTLAPALLFTASCSSDFSWQSQQALAKAMTSPCQRLCFHCLSRGTGCTGAPEILSVCVCSSISREIRLAGKYQSLFFSERILSDLDDFLQIPPFLKGMRICQITNQTKKAIGIQV